MFPQKIYFRGRTCYGLYGGRFERGGAYRDTNRFFISIKRGHFAISQILQTNYSRNLSKVFSKIFYESPELLCYLNYLQKKIEELLKENITTTRL